MGAGRRFRALAVSVPTLPPNRKHTLLLLTCGIYAGPGWTLCHQPWDPSTLLTNAGGWDGWDPCVSDRKGDGSPQHPAVSAATTCKMMIFQLPRLSPVRVWWNREKVNVAGCEDRPQSWQDRGWGTQHGEQRQVYPPPFLSAEGRKGEKRLIQGSEYPVGRQTLLVTGGQGQHRQ